MYKNSKLDFLYIGAPRAASTWIYLMLKEHPEIAVSKKKECLFINEEWEFETERYKQCFDKESYDKIKGAFPVTCMLKKNNAEAVKKIFPNIKIIACLRNPIERAYSQYLHHVSLGKISKKVSFKNAICNDPDILNFGRYGELLEPYFKLFKKENILIIFYEDIKTNGDKVAKKIYNFLGIDPGFKSDIFNKVINPTTRKRFKFMVLAKLYYKLKKLLPKIKNNIFGAFAIKFIKFLRLNNSLNYIYKNNLIDPMRVEIKRMKYNISQNDRVFLSKIYQDDIKKLENLLNIEINNWN